MRCLVRKATYSSWPETVLTRYAFICPSKGSVLTDADCSPHKSGAVVGVGVGVDVDVEIGV